MNFVSRSLLAGAALRALATLDRRPAPLLRGAAVLLALTPALVNCFTLAHAERIVQGRGRVRRLGSGLHCGLELGDGVIVHYVPEGRLPWGWRREVLVRRPRHAGQTHEADERKETPWP